VGNPAQNTANDSPKEALTGTPVNCLDFPLDGYETEDVYKAQISKYFTLADLSIGGASGPYKIISGALQGHKIKAQNIATRDSQPTHYGERAIACNLKTLATTLLDPINDYIISQGYTLKISSGFRQGTSPSDHGRGLAADLIFYKNGTEAKESERVAICNWISSNLSNSLRQIIFEKMTRKGGGGWIHVAAKTSTVGDSATKVLTICVNDNFTAPGIPASGYTLLS
jgi:pyrrolidone-carboxylate peptidase